MHAHAAGSGIARWKPWRQEHFLRMVMSGCLVGIVSYLAAGVGSMLTIHPQVEWPIWPGDAILVSVLLLVQRRIWPILIAATLAAYILFEFQTGLTPHAIGLLVLAEAVEILVAAWGLRYFLGEDFKLDSVKALAKYSLFAVVLAPLSLATIGAFVSPGNYWTIWKGSYLTEALGFLIVVPAIVGWFQEGMGWTTRSRGHYIELGALIAALIPLGYLTFDTFRRGDRPFLLYSLVPILLWAAFRFGPMGVGTSIIVISFLATWGAIHGAGPFNHADGVVKLQSLQLFLFFVAALFMVLAVLAEDRKRVEQERKNSEEKFSKSFRNSPMALTVTSIRDHRYIEVNETFERISGYSRDEVLGRTPFDIGIWLRPSHRLEIVDRLQKEGSLSNIEHQFRTKSGEIRLGRASAELIEINGDPCMLAVIEDVTDRTRVEEHFRLAVESAPNGVLILNQQGIIALVNVQAEKQFGYRRDELFGQPIDILLPDSLRKGHADFRKDFMDHPTAIPMERGKDLRARRKDGTEFLVEVGLIPMQTREGTKILCSVVDITERRMAEQALRESEERFRLVANSAPVMIWMSGTDKLCTFVNQGWLNFTGRTLENELGEGWTSSVHPEDLARCLEVYSTAFDAHHGFTMEYRVRRYDGQYRWVMARGVPRFESEGRFQGYIGTAIDITDRKLSEEALLDMSGRLITAHEEERARIARELHDDLSQQMALLQIRLDQFNMETPDLAPAAKEHLHKIAGVAAEVSSDIHNMSHELHPSKLDALGLLPAVEGYCREFSKQHGMPIRFAHHDVPGQIPKNVILCFFRILQEALRNMAKHSGAGEAIVELSGHHDRIELCVSDAGVGFDTHSAKGFGLGLISMRERIRLVGGEFLVDAAPLHGTRIRCRVPLSTNQQSSPDVKKAGV